jgi:predicted amidohydrolase/GNAT superfamily N-acetyltransferase
VPRKRNHCIIEVLNLKKVFKEAMIRVSAYQAAPKTDFLERKQQIHEILSKADNSNIDFICFPEGFLTGYYESKENANENSLEVKGALFQEWLREIAAYRVTIIIGFNEYENGKLYDSVAAIEKGCLLGVQRKHFLYHNYFTPGTDFTCFVSKKITFGIIVCLDSNYFEPSRLLALQGALIIFCPMCNKVPIDHDYAKKPPYYSHFVARSHENRLWLVTADWVWPHDGKTICPGHSCIYDPDGKEIARSKDGSDDLLIVDIPHERLFHDKGKRVSGSPSLAVKLKQKTGMLMIELLNKKSVDMLYQAFAGQPYNKTVAIYEEYYQEQQSGLREVYVAKINEKIVGYVTIVWSSPYPYFAKDNIPEIKDLNVVVERRKQGIGTKLIKHVELIAKEKGCTSIGIGVGVTSDYDEARSLYPSLNYVPDGRGVYIDEHDPCGCTYLTKSL